MDGRYLVLYDIADNKRLARAAAIVLDYGIRIQRSVYEVRVSPSGLVLLKQRLAAVIDPEKDGVKIFPLCESCAGRRASCGRVLSEAPESVPWLVL